MSPEEARRRAVALQNTTAEAVGMCVARQQVTVVQLAERYLREHGRDVKSVREESKRITKHILPNIGHAVATQVTADDLRNLHAKISARAPTEADRVIDLYQRIVEKGLEWRVLPAGFENPADEVERSEEPHRRRWVTPDEMIRLFHAIGELRDLHARAYFLLHALTGAPEDELRSARWEDYSARQCQLCLRDETTGEPNHWILSERAIAILNALTPKRGCPYIFAGRVQGAPIRNAHRAWVTVTEAAGVQGATLHDLRHTVTEWVRNRGSPLPGFPCS